ncbi:hypothetical protein COV42_01860 [Candidatus Campbellbacteria bacterium CG11_big_fil_rev_8_21_14_0_20_44_21]|nr:MAG: hypothetical protein COV42_01860 [Candidatus Campbellbacteria bacterium CG11_big_fil_rev_8_21_14_0_20_44_21]
MEQKSSPRAFRNLLPLNEERFQAREVLAGQWDNVIEEDDAYWADYEDFEEERNDDAPFDDYNWG